MINTQTKCAEAKTLHVQVATEKHVWIISVNLIPVTGLPKIRDTTHGQQLERGQRGVNSNLNLDCKSSFKSLILKSNQ